MALDVRPVEPAQWDALARFFGPSGAYAGCWCVWWRRTSSQFEAGCRDGAVGNRAVLRRLTEEGRVPGLLAYDDGSDPVGWVSVAPRPGFGRVLRSPALKPRTGEGRGDPEDTAEWAAVCFWVPRGRRGKGVATALLDAAVDHARASGAAALEGYPVVTRDEKVPAAGLFTGSLAMFRRAGFVEVQPAAANGRRSVVRLSL